MTNATTITVAELRKAALKSAGKRFVLEQLLHDVLIERLKRADDERAET